jgi:erythrin-vacuolar iron transport family protein
MRGAITGGGTFLGGVFHTLPFLIPGYQTAIAAAIVIVAAELLLLGWLRHRFFNTSFVRSFVSVTVGGAIIASLSAALGVLQSDVSDRGVVGAFRSSWGASQWVTVVG